ncbi:FapA family protein [Desulfosporosinus sp. HMP52]|uniref:FapA family protein n=1 Tax=Desulfosporosinus sp. HMP52 TaxID=1487923 RepID=UPI0009DD84D6|nr:FapA family protein [Desulfosporosinus sp. HMP52]
MPEIVVQSPNLEELKKEWALKLNILPEQINLEVIDKPSILSRMWKVKVIWAEVSQTRVSEPSLVKKDGSKYIIVLGEGSRLFIPSGQVGEVWFNGVLQVRPFIVKAGDQVEFQPVVQKGHLTWELDIRFQGLSVMAKVKHEPGGHYILPESLPGSEEINLATHALWKNSLEQDEMWNEAKLISDLERLKIVYGIKQGIWEEILRVKGYKELVIAQGTLPVPPEHARLEDFVGSPQEQNTAENKKIDFFASKLQVVKEGAVLARKIPGRPGIPGKDVLGRDLPAAGVKDFQFRLKKNVCLSPDQLEVIAACSGQPIRIDERTYMVENILVQNSDVDLASGSIEFPGDVFINGNVQDGLRVFVGGKLEIKGSVSHAEIRAEKGAKIYQNLIGGKVIIGEKYVIRSELLRLVSELEAQLSLCLQRSADFGNSPDAINLKPGQCLKMIIERQFFELPKLAQKVEKFVLENKHDEIITEGLIVSIRTAKHFLTGLGPLELQSTPFLQRVNQALSQFIENLTVELPDKLSFSVNYLQGASVECGGSFECLKGTYNSHIRVEGDVTIQGVCRGGKILAGGKVQIRELGGSEVSSTFVQISPTSRLHVEYCHANVVIAVGKEILQIEEAYRSLDIYREAGRVQIEKIRANP